MLLSIETTAGDSVSMPTADSAALCAVLRLADLVLWYVMRDEATWKKTATMCKRYQKRDDEENEEYGKGDNGKLSAPNKTPSTNTPRRGTNRRSIGPAFLPLSRAIPRPRQ